MDATCAIQASIHVFSLVRKYVSRILGTYQPLKWCWASLLSCFGAFFEDKTACVLFAFLCYNDTLPSAHHGNCTFSG